MVPLSVSAVFGLLMVKVSLFSRIPGTPAPAPREDDQAPALVNKNIAKGVPRRGKSTWVDSQ